MAVTATLVYVGHDSLRYLLSQDGAAGTTLTITTTGAASPDLLTDSVAGPIKTLAKTFTDGFAGFAAGAQTQAKARALWLSQQAGADPTPGDPAGVNPIPRTAQCSISPRTGIAATSDWRVDANVDGGGHPTLNITAQTGASSAYLDVRVANAIGA